LVPQARNTATDSSDCWYTESDWTLKEAVLHSST
jgi:hypothetical protein